GSDVQLLSPWVGREMRLQGKWLAARHKGDLPELRPERLILLDVPLLTKFGPLLLVLVVLPGLFAPFCFRSVFGKPEAYQANYWTSLLCGMMHAFAWPSPVPLFFLGLGLGWLAHRCQSLTASLVLHSLFNAVACVGMVVQLVGR